jgi:hypothetical protein
MVFWARQGLEVDGSDWNFAESKQVRDSAEMEPSSSCKSPQDVVNLGPFWRSD